jgi:hypothetical protein
MQMLALLRTCRAIELSLVEYLRALWPAFSMTAFMALVLGFLVPQIVTLPPVLQLVIAVVAGVAAYAAAGVALHRTRLLSMILALRGGFQSAVD